MVHLNPTWYIYQNCAISSFIRIIFNHLAWEIQMVIHVHNDKSLLPFACNVGLLLPFEGSFFRKL